MAATARQKGGALEVFYAIEGKRARWKGAALEIFYTTTLVRGQQNGAALELFYVPGIPTAPQGRWNGGGLEVFYSAPPSTGGGGVGPSIFARPLAANFMPGPVAQQNSP